MECSDAIIRIVLFIFNFLSWLIGGAIVGIGIWAYVEKSKYYLKDVSSVKDVISDLSIIFLVIGVIIFVTGFFGCVGALRENIILLRIFYIILTVIFLLLIVAAVLAFVFRDKVEGILTSLLQDKLIKDYHEDPDNQALLDWFQENVKCCGISKDGYKDYNKNPYFECIEENASRVKCSVPYSCCINPNTISPNFPNILCGADVLKEESLNAAKIVFNIGCIEATIKLVESNLPIVGGIVVAVVVPLLLGICLTLILIGSIQDRREMLSQSARGHRPRRIGSSRLGY